MYFLRERIDLFVYRYHREMGQELLLSLDNKVNIYVDFIENKQKETLENYG